MTLFVLLFAIASSLSIFSQFYQTIHLEEWLTSCSGLGDGGGIGIPSQILVGNLISSEPSPLIYFSRHLQFFIIGFSCAIWIFNGKTFQSFRDCWDRQCHRGRSRVPTIDH
uniref:Frizzled/Smoothened transmembrane domain-containing protein n=1 Tax=Panagrolaimus sp. PS1159 TaxID=55785 RepID=A0AC35FXC6_9BILA